MALIFLKSITEKKSVLAMCIQQSSPSKTKAIGKNIVKVLIYARL
jgi:hypothetical protein